MGVCVIAAIPLNDDHLVVWFDNGTSRRYTAKDLGIADENGITKVTVVDNGERIAWGEDNAMSADELAQLGTPANYVEDEKKRLLKNLSEIRREASFSQTRLGEAAGIRQSVISRIEGCEISPQINTLLKLLAPLGKTLAIVDLEDYE